MSSHVPKAPIKNPRETVIGGVVMLLLMVALVSNAASRHRKKDVQDTYTLEAVFHRSEGLMTGADVRVAGVPVGKVVAQTLDDQFRAHVRLSVHNDVKMPVDTAAVIETDGLLGSKYVELQPGGDTEMLEPGQRVEITQGSLVIEDLLAKIVAMGHAKRENAALEAEQQAKAAGAGAGVGAGAGAGESASPVKLPSPAVPPTPVKGAAAGR